MGMTSTSTAVSAWICTSKVMALSIQEADSTHTSPSVMREMVASRPSSESR